MTVEWADAVGCRLYESTSALVRWCHDLVTHWKKLLVEETVIRLYHRIA